MPCYCPLDAWPAAPPGRGVVFSPRLSYVGAKPLSLPCGRCIGCRLSRASEWATRISHEASLHSQNSFLTLTYSPVCLPSDLSISTRSLQLFLKRLRKHLDTVKVRFVACGEYGSQTQRPHYHIILFGYDFSSDRQPWRKSKTGHVLYRSATLEKLWPYGNSEIGTVTPESGGYVARYTLKKIYGDNDLAASNYAREAIDPETGEVRRWEVQREFFLTSRRPGIGSGWYERFSSDAFPSDFVIVSGQKRAVPRYYRQKLAAEDARMALALTHERTIKGREDARRYDNSDARLLERQEFTTLQSERFQRDIEE